MEHSRRLMSLRLALLSAAALTVAVSGALGQTGEPAQATGSAAAVPAGDPPKTGSRGETLRHAVRGRFLIGAAVSPRRLDDPKLAEFVAQQFDCLTAENEFKPRSLHPQPERFNFAAADRVVEFAQRHGMKVVGTHPLLAQPVARVDVPWTGRQAAPA